MMTMGFSNYACDIFLVGKGASTGLQMNGHLGQSLWLDVCKDRREGAPPPVDLEGEKIAGALVNKFIAEGWIAAVHDISDGGLAVALAEMALASNRGVTAGVYHHGMDEKDKYSPEYWFGEGQGRYLVVPQSQRDLEAMLQYVDELLGEIKNPNDAWLSRIGDLEPEWENHSLVFSDLFNIPLADLRAAHESFFKDWMEG
jgi:phosphoribosylformylglycinamidine synthase